MNKVMGTQITKVKDIFKSNLIFTKFISNIFKRYNDVLEILLCKSSFQTSLTKS
jgi:hypothetical protein